MTTISFALKKLSNGKEINSWYSGKGGLRNITVGSKDEGRFLLDFTQSQQFTRDLRLTVTYKTSHIQTNIELFPDGSMEICSIIYD